ncbi:MAG: carbamoyltransferase [Bradyrhizobium sp.]|jgi:carbamoyltransferase|nr:carbamoyltransferase [Bradyrhizobium sp.]
MYSLGVNLSHDRSACLVNDAGEVIAIAEERLDRVRHSCPQDRLNRMFAVVPQQSVRYCLQAGGIGFEDLDAVVFCNAAIIGGNVIRNLSVADCMVQMPWSPRSHLATVNHHLAHALSAFVPSGFDEAAIVVADKAGSVWDHWQRADGIRVPLLERASVYRASGESIELVTKVHDRPGDWLWNCNSAGAVYEMATLQIGCAPFDAGKTMGLAPYGSTVYADELRHHLELTEDGFQISPTIQSVGVPLFPHFYSRRFGPVNPSPDNPSQQHANIARAGQEVIEEIMLHLSQIAYEKTGLRRLCIAGGLGLNCVANTRIAKALPFDEMFVQPAATDDGTAIGAAFHGLSLLNSRPARVEHWRAALGRTYAAAEVDKAIGDAASLQADYTEMLDASLAEVARVVADGGVVGWFCGGSEFGPRALGHRSLIADPRPPRMRAFLNGHVKHREQYRPFGASVLADRASEYFDVDRDEPYMLFVCQVRPERRSEVASIVHIDGSCRIQTVRHAHHPVYHDLILEFAMQSGLPMVLNTSFNGKGEPIVESPADAIKSGMAMKLDALFLDGRFFVRRQQTTRFRAWEGGG